MKNVLTLMVGLALFIGCQQPSNTHDTSTGTQDVNEQAKDSLQSTDTNVDSEPSQPRNQLIVPGKQIGNIEIGAPADTLEKLLGKPDVSDAAMGKAWLTWYSKQRDAHNNRNSIDVFTNYADSTMQKKTVQQIRISSSDYRTPNGVDVYDALASIQQKYPDATMVGRFKELNGDRVFSVYDDLKNGIAFEIVDANSQKICVGIIVHMPGKKVIGLQP